MRRRTSELAHIPHEREIRPLLRSESGHETELGDEIHEGRLLAHLSRSLLRTFQSEFRMKRIKILCIVTNGPTAKATDGSIGYTGVPTSSSVITMITYYACVTCGLAEAESLVSLLQDPTDLGSTRRRISFRHLSRIHPRDIVRSRRHRPCHCLKVS